jgi:hypothetical protein
LESRATVSSEQVAESAKGCAITQHCRGVVEKKLAMLATFLCDLPRKQAKTRQRAKIKLPVVGPSNGVVRLNRTINKVLSR